MKLNRWLRSFSVLDGFSDDSVEGPSSIVGDDPGVDFKGVSLLVFFNIFLFLELLKTPSDDLGASVIMRLRGAVSPLQSSVDVREQSDSGVRPQVDLAGQRGHPSVDPIVIERGELVSCIKR